MIKYSDIFEGIGVQAAMNKKENNIDLKEMDVSLENPVFDLKAIRESRGLTLSDVSSSTKVGLSNLKAIEEQKFELLPDPIYARAFISAYARTVDIDSEEILSLYDKYLESLEPGEDKNEILKRLAEKKSYTEFWVWLTIVSCVIALMGFFYLYQWNKDDSREMKERAPVGEIENSGDLQDRSGDVQAPGKDGIATAEGGKTLETESFDLSGSADISDADDIKGTGPVIKNEQSNIKDDQLEKEAVPNKAVAVVERHYTLVIKASELTWMRINRDEEPPFEVMLRPGERITEKASEKFGLIIGNAGGVDLSFQGKLLGIIGKHGEVVRLTLPADM
ncbi:MAG: helix-turn-helix domain-containing protein [Deltaproteobacteria bacterium]|nr:helix-turn-helix domain-containing protein [Deltaproteobacteria bacterium]